MVPNRPKNELDAPTDIVDFWFWQDITVVSCDIKDQAIMHSHFSRRDCAVKTDAKVDYEIY